MTLSLLGIASGAQAGSNPSTCSQSHSVKAFLKDDERILVYPSYSFFSEKGGGVFFDVGFRIRGAFGNL